MKSRLVLRAYLFSTVILTVLAAALRALAFFKAYDASVGYFNANPFSSLLYIVLGVAVLLALTLAIYLNRNEKTAPAAVPCPESGPRALLPRIAALLTALLFALVAISDLWGALNSATLFSLMTLRGVCALAAIPYFVLSPSPRTAVSGIGAVVYGLSALTTEYFDLFVTANHPVKLMQQFTCLALLLYLISEIFAAAGRRCPARAFAFGGLSFVLGVTNAVSCLAAPALLQTVPKAYLLRALVLLALSLYAFARLFAAAASFDERKEC